MKSITVAKAFVLTLAGAVAREIKAGVQEVEDAVADHWFTKAHLAPEPAPVEKTAEELEAEAKAKAEADAAAAAAAKKAGKAA